MYSDFDLSGFIAPDKAWTPPYPYCPDDVLFPVESVETEHGISPTLLLGSLPVSVTSEDKRERTIAKSKN